MAFCLFRPFCSLWQCHHLMFVSLVTPEARACILYPPRPRGPHARIPQDRRCKGSETIASHHWQDPACYCRVQVLSCSSRSAQARPPAPPRPYRLERREQYLGSDPFPCQQPLNPKCRCQQVWCGSCVESDSPSQALLQVDALTWFASETLPDPRSQGTHPLLLTCVVPDSVGTCCCTSNYNETFGCGFDRLPTQAGETHSTRKGIVCHPYK